MPATGETLQNGLIAGLNAIITSAPQDPQRIQEAITQLAANQAKLIDNELQSQLDKERSKLLLAEIQNADLFTQRARPMVVYAGLVFIFVLHVLLPSIAFLNHSAAPTAVLPEEFWWSWTGVVSVWVLGRSYEKVNVPNTISKIITGTKPS